MRECGVTLVTRRFVVFRYSAAHYFHDTLPPSPQLSPD